MPVKSFYKSREASEILGVPTTTLYYWERKFEVINPARINGHRRYTSADIEVLKKIKELLHNGKTRIRDAQKIMASYRRCPPRRIPKCGDSRTALHLLEEIADMTDNEHVLARVEALKGWINQTDSQN